MARPYSADLRERVLRAHERREGSQRVLAERFGVSLGAVCTWLQQARAEGRRAPRPMGGRCKPLGGTDPAVLAAIVAERRDATLAEYAAMLAARVGRRFSRPALCRALARAGLPRKKRRSTPASESAPTSPRRARPGTPR
jgi:transposase